MAATALRVITPTHMLTARSSVKKSIRLGSVSRMPGDQMSVRKPVISQAARAFQPSEHKFSSPPGRRWW
jgi:hypothetical protein